MTRPLRREISAELLRTTTVVPSVAKKLAAAAKVLGEAVLEPGDEAALDAVEKEIEAIEGLSFQVTTFPNNPRAPLPNHGLAEEVITTTWATPVGKKPSDPFLSRERAFIVRVLAAKKANRKDFDTSGDANRKAFLDAIRPRMVSAWAERQLSELGSKIDVKPLRIKYGVLQKE